MPIKVLVALGIAAYAGGWYALANYAALMPAARALAAVGGSL